MDILNCLFSIAVIILFPMFCYFLFASDANIKNKRTNKIIFDLALYSSIYFILKNNCPFISFKVMFLTVPLLIAYLKSKPLTVIVFSICIGLYYVYPLGISPLCVIIEFFLYFIFIYFLKRGKESNSTIISVFAIIKITFIILELQALEPNSFDVIKQIMIIPFGFFFTTQLIWSLMASTEKTMSLHLTLKELEKQKQLQDSLFKITHEIKNPIAVCKGYLDMIDVDDKDQVKRYIPIIKQEIERTLTLMNDFMMLTKININTCKMDISVLLQDICDTAILISKNAGSDFVALGIDEELYVEGDYDRLKQVFLNIIKNAIEAIPKKKKGLIKLETKIKNKELIIMITDNGIGMGKQELNRIGEVFYTTKKMGTGLGVKFSKEIIDAHKGSLQYKSKLNEGTTVIVKLPIEKSLK